jgi:hypothetical protein
MISTIAIAATLSAALAGTPLQARAEEGLLEVPALSVGGDVLRMAVLANPVPPLGGLASSQDPAESGLVQAHRVLKPLTAGSLLLTVALGTLLVINYPTFFGEGHCSTGGPVFGTYGCDALNIVHGVSAVMSVVLYTATTVLELTPEVQAVPERHPEAQRYLRYVHLVGFILQPILGIISSYPQIIGISTGGQAQFSRVMRSVHLSIGYVTLGAYAASTVLDF